MDYFGTRALEDLRLNENANALVVGDSHVEVSINDSLLPFAVNLAQSQEPLFFSYFKTRILLRENPSIDILYLGVSYHSLSSGYDQLILGPQAQQVASGYFFILPFEEKVKLLIHNLENILSLLSGIVSDGLQTVFLNDEKILGGYHNEFIDVKADTVIMQKRLDRHFFENGRLYDFSVINIEALKQIKTLCEKTNTKLVILNTPLHPYYYEQVPEKFKKKYYSVIKELDLELIDLADLPLKERSYTPDGDHVSKEGAMIVTQKLNEYHQARFP